MVSNIDDQVLKAKWLFKMTLNNNIKENYRNVVIKCLEGSIEYLVIIDSYKTSMLLVYGLNLD